jgi:putative transposase
MGTPPAERPSGERPSGASVPWGRKVSGTQWAALLTETARRKPLGLSPGGEAGFRWLEPEVLVCSRFCAARLEYSSMSEQTTCRKTYKEKLRPTPTQKRALEGVLWRCRILYNTALEQRIFLWKQRGVSISRYQQEGELKALRAELPEYGALHAHILQDVLARLEKTYQAFFRRVASGAKPGFPRFHGKNRYHSFTYKEFGNGARLDNGYLVLSKIGRIAVRWSRPIQGTIKTVTISREADGWYVSFSCAEVPLHPLPQTGQQTGIDVGLKVFLVTADGDVVANPRHYRTCERELQKANRRVSRRKKGSRRWWKAVHQCRKKHQHVRRQRADFHHKTALGLVRAYDTIYVEALQPANLSRRPEPKQDENGTYAHNGSSRKAGLNKSIHDAGWRHFLSILAYTAACAGKRVEAVNPADTSQKCSGCGEQVPKGLSVRTHVCINCGLVLDRDLNAAKNIQRLGQSLRGVPAVVGAMNREPVGL